MQKQHKRMNCLCARNQYSHANEVPEVYEAVLCLNDSLWNNHVKVQLQFILPQGVLKAFFTPEFFMTKRSEEKGRSWDHLYMKICFAPELGVFCNKTQRYVKHFAPAFQKNLFQVLLTCISLKSVEGCRSIVKGNHKGFFKDF